MLLRAMKRALQLLYVVICVCHFSKANVRLVGGSQWTKGRVEVYYNGQWGTVCDHSWDINDANVVCRSLGFPRALAALYDAAFGRGTGPILLSYVNCRGSESSLFQCPHGGWGITYSCRHDDDASAECAPPDIPLVKLRITNLTGEITSPGYPHSMPLAHYEWTFRPPIPRAHVFVNITDIDLLRSNGMSYLVLQDSTRSDLVYVNNNSRHDVIPLAIETTTGKVIYYSSLTSNRGLRRQGFRMKYYAFSSPQNDKLCIKNWNMSLTQNDPGRINVSWSPVPQTLHQYGSTYTYLVLYKTAKSSYGNFASVLGSSSRKARIEFLHPNRMYSIGMVALDTQSTNSTTIYSCPQFIKTVNVTVRLVGGNFSNEGRVEVFYHGIWGTICPQWWDLNDATVVCRSLGLPAATYALRYKEFGRASSERIWMTDLRCSGKEENLAMCPHRGWSNYCRGHYYTASTVCGRPEVLNINVTTIYGVITSPGYPKYMEQAHYVWTFRPYIPMVYIAIYVEDADLYRRYYYYGSSKLYIQDSSGYRPFYLSNRRVSPIGIVLKNMTGRLIFYSSFTTIGKGFRMRYLLFDRPLNDAYSYKASIMASSTNPNSISVDCSSFTVDGFKVHGYLITCNSTDDWHSTVLYAIAANKTKTGSFHRLVGLTNYKVQVFAVGTNITDGSMMMYKSDEVQIQTKEGVPSAYPHGLRVVSLGTSTVHLRWNPIPRDQTHGALLGYRVYYYNHENYHTKNINTNDTHVFLDHLLPGMEYRIYVRGYTSKGQGPKRSIYTITKCGRNIEDKSHGTLANLSYKNVHWHMQCLWTLKAPSRTGLIVVLLNTVDLPVSHFCGRWYVSLYDDRDQEVHKLCGLRKSFTFTSSGSAKIRTYFSDWRRRTFVIKATYFILESSFDKVPVEPIWKYIIAESTNSSTINVQWSQYPLSSNNLAASTQVLSYLAVCIAVKDHNNISVASTNGTERSVIVSHLGKYTEYYVQVVAVLSNSSESTSVNETVFRSSRNITVRTLEDVPSKPPVIINAQAKTPDNILVEWNPIPNEYIHGILLGYHVYYQPLSNKSLESRVFVHANDTYVELQKLGFRTEYRIRVAGLTEVGEGPKSRAVFLRTGLDCNEDLSGRYGQFLSPNFPSNYPNDANCKWTIGQNITFKRIIIVFHSFELEEGQHGLCSNDHVKITDFKGNDLGQGNYCGKRSTFGVVSQRPTEVILHSDKAFEKKGFNATYYVIDKYSKDIELKVNSSTITDLMLDIEDIALHFAELVVLYKEKEGQTTWNVSQIASLKSIIIRGLRPSTQYEARAVGYLSGRVYYSKIVAYHTQKLPITHPNEKTNPPTTAPLKQMYDYGPSAGDSIVPHTWGHLQKCFGVELNDDGIPILMKRYHKVYICHNGVIRFGAHAFPRWPTPFSERTEGCKLGLPMLAPYWATTDPYFFYQPRISTVYYQKYTSSQKNAQSLHVLNRATLEVNRFYKEKEEFRASLVLVVTWENLRHINRNSETRNLHNTFQALIITDGFYPYVMYNYKPDGIQWSAPTTRAKWPLYTKGSPANDPLPVVGWSAGCKKNQYFNVPRSGEVTIGHIGTMDGCYTVYDRVEGYKTVNNGVKGKWLFRLETSASQWSVQQCKSWFKRQPDPRPFLEYLEPCPCTFFQARWDERFYVEEEWRGKSEVCAYQFFVSASLGGWQQKCCYSNDWRSRGALIVGHPGGGNALRNKYHKNKVTSDDEGHEKCCKRSAMCHLFYQRRPSDDCKQYEPPEWSWMWGDPHFVTLDGKNYTFNGLGEYVMLDAKEGFFQLQARTRLAKGDGTATVFCAAVAKERNASKVQINLDGEGNMTLLVDGETTDYYSLTNHSTRLNGSIAVSRPKENAFRATFPSGISVTVTNVKSALSILLALPKSFKNKTKGLLGTWNGNQRDDLTTPSGAVLDKNATSKDIHFQFGQKWQVSEMTSLFTYQFGENVSTFSNTSFVPMFLDDLKFYNKSLERQAYAACKGDINCLFDSASTKDVSVGVSTKKVGAQMVNESNTLKNSPPQFTNTSATLYLKVNVSNRVTFMAKDPDGDKIRFDIPVPPDDATVWTNETSVTMEWLVTTTPVNLEVIATDIKGATFVLRPMLHVCACHNGGDCLSSSQEQENSNNSRFIIMACRCSSGYTGRFCEGDIDACEVNMNPCYPGVQCEDLPAPANETGYECGCCPKGFSGQGDSCSDINECDGMSHGCSQICVNTPGSFTCGCIHGYLLDDDGVTCNDVNECDPASDCMQGCQNTPGSYICTCDKYFTVDPDNPKRCIPKSPCKDGNHHCQHICYVTNGVNQCACQPGYDLQRDNKSCSDIDECATGKNRCNQDCRNTIGWYDCECHSGYRLDTDNVTCIDIDECLEWIFNCSSNLRCRNTIGSYECKCRKGLVLNEGECQEPEKPTTDRTPSTSRPPSERDIQNSVNVTIQDLNISEWNHEQDQIFKQAVAQEITEFCANGQGCFGRKRRVSRSDSANVIFTAKEVHLLPGYPVQVSYSSTPDHMVAVVAFYVTFPPGIAIGATDLFDKDLLVDIVNGSLVCIGRAMNKTILSVSVYMAEKPTRQSTKTAIPTDSRKRGENPGYVLYLVIGGSVLGALLFIAIVGLIIRKSRDNSPASIKKEVEIEMKMQHGDFSIGNLGAEILDTDKPAYNIHT